jgi:hypothetical protein
MSYAIFATEQAATDFIASVDSALGYPKQAGKVGGGHRLTVNATSHSHEIYGSTANKWAVKLDKDIIELVPAGTQVKHKLPANFSPAPEAPVE